ncbi:hypothetical protein [Paenibacillus sp. HW567]|uniref:hypothetical protein n=1 Tax=Paenibacillus sp. HW567 TaxID=1034769 RepID=UPI000364A86B|nr:hypothetical protein [Paenibacillus sp. HW567]
MKLFFRVLGILFAMATIAINIFLLIKDYSVNDQALRTWSMVLVSGTLIFNGGYYYLKNKNAVMMLVVGVIILVVTLFTSPF